MNSRPPLEIVKKKMSVADKLVRATSLRHSPSGISSLFVSRSKKECGANGVDNGADVFIELAYCTTTQEEG